MSTGPISFEAFRSALNTRFRALSAGRTELELIQAVPGRNSPVKVGAQTFEIFSLIFTTPEDAVLPQATYTLEHERLGRLELFLVPIGRKAGSIEYEAIFNRPVVPS